MARDLIEAIVSNPLSLADARRREKDGGVPNAPGIYAWWVTPRDALGNVPTSPHPADDAIGLIYVGVAPQDDVSTETLRSRVLKRHAGSSLSDSTFRRSLAALLWDDEGWTPCLTDSDRFTLSAEDNAALRAWQARYLLVSWVHVARPWDVEAFAIGELEPPFNLRDNGDHPFYESMSEARRRFRATAEARQLREGD